MANTTEGVFIFLVAFSVVAVAMLFDGIARMKRNGAPPFNEGLVTSVDMLPRPPGGGWWSWRREFGGAWFG